MDWPGVIKIFAMIVMFLLIIVVGSLPIRIKSFKSNPLVLSMTKAFSGGLFLAVGLVHLLPEANEHFENYYKEQDIKQNLDHKDHFPMAFLILVSSFSLILFIEKIITDHHHKSNEHDHDHNLNDILEKSLATQLVKNRKISDIQSRNDSDISEVQQNLLINHQIIEEIDNQDEQAYKQAIKTQNKIARSVKLSINKQRKASMAKPDIKPERMNLTPFILQIAIGIHAVFEGLSIGLAKETGEVLALSAAVICHKWAEGLTLGLAFADADIPIKLSTIMIGIQAIMNPIGIAIGWALSGQGEVIIAIFTSISAGTFLYISTVEVITEEFSIARYKVQKFLLFLFAIAFVCSLYFVEQATEGNDDK